MAKKTSRRDWSWLQGTYWYCPQPYMPAIRTQGPTTFQWVADQTVWHVSGYSDGYFWGVASALLTPAGEQPDPAAKTDTTFFGSLTPRGRVQMTFIQSPRSSTVGTGRVRRRRGSPSFEMQMSSGSAGAMVVHWADMGRVQPGDPAWESLPGAGVSVPEMVGGIQPPAPLAVAPGRQQPAAESGDSEPSAVAGLHDLRYCEVVPVTRQGDTLTSWIYNTTNLNDCPAPEWEALTEEQVNQAYGSLACTLNGPRHWVVDSISASGSSTTGERFTFGGIEMALVGTSESGVQQSGVGSQPYTPNEVRRDTVYTYLAGGSVYELTSPEGDVYVMQSYAQIVDESLTLDGLAELGDRLQLPEGWSYSPRTLTEDLELDSGGLAQVIIDNLANTYQRRA